MNFDIKNFERADDNQRIYEALIRFEKVLKEHGYQTTAFRDDSQKQKFFTLSYIDIERIRVAFMPYFNSLMQAKEQGIDLSDHKKVLAFFIASHDWQLLADMNEKINEKDVIQIYNRNIHSIFRSLNYFDHSTYSLFETFTHDYWQLYDRDNSILQDLANKRGMLLRGEVCETLAAEAEDHYIKERFSEKLASYLIRQKHISPVLNAKGRAEAVIRTYEVLKRIDN
jgi:hypothetical protein